MKTQNPSGKSRQLKARGNCWVLLAPGNRGSFGGLKVASCCYDKKLVKKQLKEEGLILAYSTRRYTPLLGEGTAEGGQEA